MALGPLGNVQYPIAFLKGAIMQHSGDAERSN